jgi:pyruvate dehydrogenase E2 component (dihydrolipoamide acetyltransferase)
MVEYPYMNVQLTEQGIRQMATVNLGLAVDSERGLLVPVVRSAERLTVKGFALAFRDLVERARGAKCQPDELTGGTFTITNMGMFGVDSFTPIINLPECAILGVGRIRPVPAVVGGEVVVRQTMWLSLTVDHRLVDGAPAARFLQGIVRYIEAPYLLLA